VIVLDASAVLDLLLGTPTGRSIGDRIADAGLGLHAPHLLDVEVTQALRRLVRDGELEARSAVRALADLSALDIRRHGHEMLLERAWALRGNLTAYDAMYVALAEAMGGILLTCDGKLARALGNPRWVELMR
jgi:predicted nucleic acid-binding protein